MQILRAQRYRLHPTVEQAVRLAAWQGALRWLWNLALEQYLMHGERRCRVDRQYPSFVQQCKDLTELRAEFPWLADVPTSLCQQVLKELAEAWQRCWTGSGMTGAPRFKSGKRGDRAVMREPGKTRFEVILPPAKNGGRRRYGERKGHLDFPKVGKVPGRFHRDLLGPVRSCTLTTGVDPGEWWCSVLVEQSIPDPPAVNDKPPVGIDRGVVNMLADSNGRVVVNPRFGELSAKRVARSKRSLSKKVKGSKNREKSKRRVARQLRRVRRQRDHIVHVQSKWYAENHGVIVVEALNVRSMTRSAKGSVDEPGVNVRQKAGLNRSILDSGWGDFLTRVRYKSVPMGASVRDVPAAYSSQECSKCGHVSADSRLTQSEFHCVSCNHREHADTNAAKVILSRGYSGDAGCGGPSARGTPTKQQRRPARTVVPKRKSDLFAEKV